MESFKKLGLSEGMLEVLESLSFKAPTEIQEKAIPLIIEGKDVIGHASTGSGKTLAFGAGIIEKIHARKGVQALVMVPTRELAIQVAKALRVFSKKFELNVAEVFGGVPHEPQVRKIKYSEIIVGTPGRVLDHIKRRSLSLAGLRWLVLDEADLMVDMGFLPDVEQIIRCCPREGRQTLLFSATSSPDMKYIEKTYMNKPEHISIGAYVDAKKLKQVYYDIQSHEKFSLLMHLLKQEKPGSVMVFCNTRRNVDIVTENITRFGLKALAIHGGLTQNRRTHIMDGFRAEDVAILICTDVAARGLDIKNVSHVYNYDTPQTANEYVHRIGRTARAGKEGEAISLVASRDYENFEKVMQLEGVTIELMKTPEFEALKPKFKSSGRDDRRGGGYGRDSRGGGSRGGYGGGRGGRSSGGSRGGYGGGSRGGDSRGGSSRGGSYGGGRRDSGRSSGGSRGGSSSYGGGSRGGDSRGPSRGGSSSFGEKRRGGFDRQGLNKKKHRDGPSRGQARRARRKDD